MLTFLYELATLICENNNGEICTLSNSPYIHKKPPSSLPSYLKEFLVEASSQMCIRIVPGPDVYTCIGPFGKGRNGHHDVLQGKEASIVKCALCQENICMHCKMTNVEVNENNMVLCLPCYATQTIVLGENHDTNNTKTVEQMREDLIKEGYELDKNAMAYEVQDIYDVYMEKNLLTQA